MNLDNPQTRRLHTAGTVAFPKPYPKLGAITFQDCSLWDLEEDCKCDGSHLFVSVQEGSGLELAVTRVVQIGDVAAIFIPDLKKWGHEDHAEDLEAGKWFVPSETKVEKTAAKFTARLKALGSEVNNKGSSPRGIVYVREHDRVLTRTESTQTARTADEVSTTMFGCDPRCW